MRAIKYILFLATHIAALWFGLVEKNDGLLNVGIAMTWFCIVISWFLLSKSSIKAMSNIKRGEAFLFFDRFVDTCIALTLIYFGWFVTGALYGVQIILAAAARSEADKLIAARELKAMADA